MAMLQTHLFPDWEISVDQKVCDKQGAKWEVQEIYFDWWESESVRG